MASDMSIKVLMVLRDILLLVQIISQSAVCCTKATQKLF